MMREKKQDVSTLTAAALMAAVLCVLGPLSVPIGPVPIAMANFAVSLAATRPGRPSCLAPPAAT